MGPNNAEYFIKKKHWHNTDTVFPFMIETSAAYSRFKSSHELMFVYVFCFADFK